MESEDKWRLLRDYKVNFIVKTYQREAFKKWFDSIMYICKIEIAISTCARWDLNTSDKYQWRFWHGVVL